MKQAVMTSPGVIEFRDVPVPKPGPDEVLVRVRRIGVCGSDIHVRHGRHPFTSYPVVQGHEFSGVIEAVGKRRQGPAAGPEGHRDAPDRLRALCARAGAATITSAMSSGSRASRPRAAPRSSSWPGPTRSCPCPPRSASSRGPWSSRRRWVSTPSPAPGRWPD
ncbi:MAG: alcohol dehydrogenase catalytic domain-containing protein [Candidatus Moduliflexus flocculans]|nr:alcohol dehydrogenase catalytic domain-containing protein [Candidatus Moduliflexus flocculans]